MHQLTGDFYTVGEVLGHTLAGIGASLGLSMNFEAVTARYVDVRLERKKEVLDAYHGAVKQAAPAKAEKAEPKKAKSAAKSVKAQNTKPEGREMAGRPRAKMSVQDRAKQFLPFAALKGLPEALAEKERVVVPKIILTEDMSEELNRKMQQIEPGMIIGVVYFHKDEYLKVTGMVARFNISSRVLQVVNTKISFDDVLDIEFCR